jgi:type IV secretion system protein VirD4
LLLPILLGTIAATQFLAARLGFHPSLGPNFLHFYPPWSYFVWSYLWRHTNPSIFAQAFGEGVMVALGSFLFLALALTRGFRANPFLHGSARWADERDIKAAGLLNNEGVYVGAWRDKRGTIRRAQTALAKMDRTNSSPTISG